MEKKLFFENVEKFVENKNAVGLIHRVYLCYLKNKRKYTASTKTKAEIRGGGRKPWRQKGTGRARAGSSRSPLWVGGGVSFGPKPRLVEKKINKKERRLATLASLYLKKKEIVFIPESTFENFDSIIFQSGVTFGFDRRTESQKKRKLQQLLAAMSCTVTDAGRGRRRIR